MQPIGPSYWESASRAFLLVCVFCVGFPTIRGCSPLFIGNVSGFTNVNILNCSNVGYPLIPSGRGFSPQTQVLLLGQNTIQLVYTEFGLATGLLQPCGGCDFGVSPLVGLLSVELQFNHISSISAFDFRGLTAMRSLRLDYNFITMMENGAFSDLTGLTTLTVGANPLLWELPGAALRPPDGNFTHSQALPELSTVQPYGCNATLQCTSPPSADSFPCSVFVPNVSSTPAMCIRATATPTFAPTLLPTEVPTLLPSDTPSSNPTSSSPTHIPSGAPSVTPTSIAPQARPSAAPTDIPASSPSGAPTTAPRSSTTLSPSRVPTTLSSSPTRSPPDVAHSPTTAPTHVPMSASTSRSPTSTLAPSAGPVASRTVAPTFAPTVGPTISSTLAGMPTPGPTTPVPTEAPTLRPTRADGASSGTSDSGSLSLVIIIVIIAAVGLMGAFVLVHCCRKRRHREPNGKVVHNNVMWTPSSTRPRPSEQRIEQGPNANAYVDAPTTGPQYDAVDSAHNSPHTYETPQPEYAVPDYSQMIQSKTAGPLVQYDEPESTESTGADQPRYAAADSEAPTLSAGSTDYLVFRAQPEYALPGNESAVEENFYAGPISERSNYSVFSDDVPGDDATRTRLNSFC